MGGVSGLSDPVLSRSIGGSDAGGEWFPWAGTCASSPGSVGVVEAGGGAAVSGPVWVGFIVGPVVCPSRVMLPSKISFHAHAWKRAS